MLEQDILKVQDPKHVRIPDLNTVEECEYIQARLEESRNTINLQLATITDDPVWKQRATCALACIESKLVEVKRKRKRLLAEIETVRRQRIEFQFVDAARRQLTGEVFDRIMTEAKRGVENVPDQPSV